MNTLLLTKNGKQAIATYLWQEGMVGADALQPFLQLLSAWEVHHGYFVTTGAFTLQAEDLVAGRPVQLIDGQELSALVKGAVDEGSSTAADAPAGEIAAMQLGSVEGENSYLPLQTTNFTTVSLQGATVLLNGHAEHTESLVTTGEPTPSASSVAFELPVIEEDVSQE